MVALIEHNDFAIAETAECAILDFKRSFDPDSASEWLELLKDIVAIANSGGGSILLGVDDDGKAVGADISQWICIDPADVTNKIYKYTDSQFHSFEFRRCLKDSVEICAVGIGTVEVPLVFVRPGTYAVEGGRHQKTAFSAGTVYFRHGAKSEPANSDDFRQFIERRIEDIRKSWLDGIAKVVEAPPGSRVTVLPQEVVNVGDKNGMPIRLSDDLNAPTYRAIPIDQTHPYRQKEVVKIINERLKGKRTITSHQILSVRRAFCIEKETLYCYTQKHASAQYSSAFIDWLVARYEENPNFFEEAKRKYDAMMVAKAR